MSYKTITNFANRANYGSYRSLNKIKYIVIHYTAVDGDNADCEGRAFKTHITKTSAHRFVDDNAMLISVPDNYVAYSVGGKKYSDCSKTGGGKLYGKVNNTNSISIEMCDTVRNGKHDVTEKTLANAAEVVKDLMKQYNIPIENIIRHFDVNGKHCPAFMMDDFSWNAFKKRLIDSCDYSLVFDAAYYSNRYPDLKAAFSNNKTLLMNHFVTFGMSEARQAISSFNVIKYRELNADLQNVFKDDWKRYYEHYIAFGYDEKRKCL